MYSKNLISNFVSLYRLGECMTTRYPTKEMAMAMGKYYSTGKMGILNKDDLKLVEGEVGQFGKTIEGGEVYELINGNGETVRIAITPDGDEFNLWLILPDGMALRA
jgi:hypothetical protein